MSYGRVYGPTRRIALSGARARIAKSQAGGLGDAAPPGVVCPPGTSWSMSTNMCQVPPPSLFQRLGSALTGFFSSPPQTGVVPGAVAPTSITQSPLFIPGVIGVGVLAVVLLKRRK